MPEPIQISDIDELAEQVHAQLEAWNLFLDHLYYTLHEEEQHAHRGVYLLLNHTCQTSSNLCQAIETFKQQKQAAQTKR